MYQILIMAVQHGIFPAVEGLINNPSKSAVIALAKNNKNYPQRNSHQPCHQVVFFETNGWIILGNRTVT